MIDRNIQKWKVVEKIKHRQSFLQSLVCIKPASPVVSLQIYPLGLGQQREASALGNQSTLISQLSNPEEWVYVIRIMQNRPICNENSFTVKIGIMPQNLKLENDWLYLLLSSVPS